MLVGAAGDRDPGFVKASDISRATSASASPSTGASEPEDAPGARRMVNREHGVICRQIQDAPAWTIAYGQEPWRPTKPAEPTLPAGQSSPINPHPTGLNTGEIIDRVTHAFEFDAASPWPYVNARTYQAVFDGDGLRFTPRHPAPANTESKDADSTRPDPEARFRTVTIRQGNQTLYIFNLLQVLMPR